MWFQKVPPAATSVGGTNIQLEALGQAREEGLSPGGGEVACEGRV